MKMGDDGAGSRTAKAVSSDRQDDLSIALPEEAKRMCLQPVYMRRFVCDGSRCGSLCCCAKWGVAFDAATLARYEARPKLLQELQNGLEKSEATGGWIMRHENGRCVFLCEDGLCSLQRRFGIGAISDVCAEYPRKMHEIGDTLDLVLCLSCPVAAEEVLFAEEPPAFEWVELAAPRPAYVDRAPLGAPLSAGAFRALQLAGLALLSERSLSLDTRLAALGLLLARAESYVEEDAAEALAKDVAAIAEAAAKEAATLLSTNPFGAAQYMDFFVRLFPALAEKTADDLPETAALLRRIGEVFGDAANGRTDVAAFLQRRRRYAERILAKHGSVLEHWLLNEFLLGRYPLTGGTSLLANYEVFVVLYKMLEFLLLAGEALDDEGAAPKETAKAAPRGARDAGQEERFRRSLLAAVQWLAVRTNHFEGFIDALAEEIAHRLPEDHLLKLLDGDL